MEAVSARIADLESWLDLVDEVEPMFGSTPTFRGVLIENIDRGTALVVHADDGSVAGGLVLGDLPCPMRISTGWRCGPICGVMALATPS